MSGRRSCCARSAVCLGFLGGIVTACVFPWPAAGEGSSAGVVVRVEEDWELVVRDPEASSNAPQVTCVMSPISDVNVAYAAFDINHHSQPGYRAGGLQLQVWYDDQPLLSDNDPQVQMLSYPGETVRWTQEMALDGGTLTIAIRNGHSLTWGDFGDGERLTATVATSLESLNGYNPQVSVENSGVGYAANRVESLVLKRVRVHTADGTVHEDDTPRVVFQHN